MFANQFDDYAFDGSRLHHGGTRGLSESGPLSSGVGQYGGDGLMALKLRKTSGASPAYEGQPDYVVD